MRFKSKEISVYVVVTGKPSCFAGLAREEEEKSSHPEGRRGGADLPLRCPSLPPPPPIFLKGQHLSNVPKALCPSFERVEQRSECKGSASAFATPPLRSRWIMQRAQRMCGITLPARETQRGRVRLANSRIGSCIRARARERCVWTPRRPCRERSHPYLLSRPAGSPVGCHFTLYSSLGVRTESEGRWRGGDQRSISGLWDNGHE